MNRLEEFKSQLEGCRKECTGTSRMGRNCPERLKLDVDEFFSETESMAIECNAVEEDSMVMSFGFLISSVVDVFAEGNNPNVTDEQYELFLKYLIELSVLRDKIMMFVKEKHCSQKEMFDRIGSLAFIIGSAHRWTMYRPVELFSDPKTAYFVAKKVNSDWSTLAKRFDGKVEEVLRSFARFKKEHHALDMNFTEKWYVTMLMDVLEGRKKMAGPVKVYKVVDYIPLVVDADSPDDVDFGILMPNDWYYEETMHIKMEVTKVIPPACKHQSSDKDDDEFGDDEYGDDEYEDDPEDDSEDAND